MIHSVNRRLKRGLSNTNTADELHTPVIPSLAYRCDQGLPAVFWKDFGGQYNGSEPFHFLLKHLSHCFCKGAYNRSRPV